MDSDQPIPRIEQLVATIGNSVAKLQEILSSKGLPPPSFDENAQFALPEEVIDYQDNILDATAELHDLLLEPLNLIHRHGGVSEHKHSTDLPTADYSNPKHNNLVGLGAIAEFKIADMVPPNGCASFREIANKTPLTSSSVPQLTASLAFSVSSCS